MKNKYFLIHKNDRRNDNPNRNQRNRIEFQKNP